jgi:hypothetical protein
MAAASCPPTHILEQEATGTGLHGPEEVLVEVESRENQDPRRHRLGHQSAGRLDPVEDRHPDIHHDDIRP